MMKHTTINATIALGLGLALTLAWLWLLGGGLAMVRAQGSDGYSTYYVAPSCSGVPVPCYTTLQAAVDAADDPEDVIKVAASIYTDVHSRAAPVGYNGPSIITQVGYISKNVSIQGGYTTAFSDPPDPNENPTTLDAQGRGRVLFISGSISPTIEGLRITGGDATGLDGGLWGYDVGGGVYAITATIMLSTCQVFSNSAYIGGGVSLLFSSGATLSGNIFASNMADYGGGLFLYKSAALVSGNTITANVANDTGGGLFLGTSDATLSRNLILSNTASLWGGGLYLYFSDASLTGNAVISNSAELGGGVLLDVSHARLNGNTVIANAANEGGGLLLGRSHATLTNNVVADNRANTLGSGIYLVVASLPHLSHNTIAHNTGGDGSGIYVTDGSAVVLTNTILVSHTVGITVAAGNTATLEATLWGGGAWANGADWGGAGTILTGTHNHWGDPAFVDPGAGDYHIGPGSAALDVGVDAGVTVDIDGEPRPSGLGYDLGADEFLATTGSGYSIYLPVVMRQSP